MPEYTIELMVRPPLSGRTWGSGVFNREVAQFADKGESVQRAQELYKANENHAIGWKVLNSGGKLVDIGMFSGQGTAGPPARSTDSSTPSRRQPPR